MNAAPDEPPDVVPAWLRRMTDGLTDVDPRKLSRLLPPADGTGRAAGVLIALAEWHNQPSVVLMQRSDALRSHAGQVAFPGGAREAADSDLVATALREAHEEAGIAPADVQVLLTLPALWIPVSDFVVTPVLGWWRRPERLRADGSEMLHAALVPLAALADPANRFTVAAPSGWRGPAFEASGLHVWGFTAGVLDKLLAFGGWEQAWDPERRVEKAPVPGGHVDEELVQE